MNVKLKERSIDNKIEFTNTLNIRRYYENVSIKGVGRETNTSVKDDSMFGNYRIMELLIDNSNNNKNIFFVLRKAIFINVEILHGNIKLFKDSGIKYPTYKAPDSVKVGDIVYVPILGTSFNEARVVEILEMPPWQYRIKTIDNWKDGE